MRLPIDVNDADVNYGGSKLVLSGHVRIGTLVPTGRQVLVLAAQDELQHSVQVLDGIPRRYLDSWFARSPTLIRAVTRDEQQHLAAAFASNDLCTLILTQPTLYLALAPKYDPVGPDDAIDIVLDDIRRPVSSIAPAHVCSRLGQALLAVLRGCWALSQQSLCHGDLKINNLFFDPTSRTFKIGDFGLTAPFDAVDYAGRFGTLLSPWYHPIFYAIQHASIDAQAKTQLCLLHAGLIDRFAFVGLIYQFYLSAGWSFLLSPTCAQQVRARVLDLVSRCRRPTPEVDANWQAFDQHSACWTRWKLDAFRSAGMMDSAAYCQFLLDHKLFAVAEWLSLYEIIYEWAYPGVNPPPFESFVTP